MTVRSLLFVWRATDLSAKAKALEYAAADGDREFIRENNDEMLAQYSDTLEKIKAAL